MMSMILACSFLIFRKVRIVLHVSSLEFSSEINICGIHIYGACHESREKGL